MAVMPIRESSPRVLLMSANSSPKGDNRRIDAYDSPCKGLPASGGNIKLYSVNRVMQINNVRDTWDKYHLIT